MHIVFLVNIFPAKDGQSTGGSGNYVANIAKEFARNGHRVSVITEAKECSHFRWHGIDVYKINATRGFKNNLKPMKTCPKFIKNVERSFFYNLAVCKINRRQKVDLVQSVNTYGLALFRLRSIPYVVRVSDHPPLWSGANKEDYDFNTCLNTKRIDEEMQFAALKKADVIITPSNLMNKLVKYKTGRKAYTIESPVCVDDYGILELDEKVLEKDKYWVTYSAMIGRKSICMLARVIDDLLEEYPDMKYVIIGKDRGVPYENNFVLASDMFYQNITKNRGRFLFMDEISDRRRLFSIVKNARACILPTRIDNLPNTVLESMALGKIVISSDKTSVEQLITDGYNGFLTQIDNEKELCEKIRYVMQMSEKERSTIEGRAQERVMNLTPENVYKKLLSLYIKTINKYSIRKGYIRK